MKIGYPCINHAIGCATVRTFRLSSYTDERLAETIEYNLECLLHVLCYNAARDMLFFRISSGLIPFASHPVCRFNWHRRFLPELHRIGQFIRTHHIRISMHPDQFTLINSPDKIIVQRSIRELEYHAKLLDLMKLGRSAKIQIHVGGVYDDKAASMRRFVECYKTLPMRVKHRLVIENDDRLYSLADCMALHGETGIPVLFDVLHHQLLNSGHGLLEALGMSTRTWRRRDGKPMVDYSQQEIGARPGMHAHTINERRFRKFLHETQPYDFDVMLEIKDKEKSALKAVRTAYLDPRFVPIDLDVNERMRASLAREC